MAISELNSDTQDQICDLIENLRQFEKLKNKDIRILLDKIVKNYGVKVVKNEPSIIPTISISYFPKCCS